MIVVMTVVVMLFVKVSDWLGGGGGSTTPGECIVPANEETASIRVRATAAPVRLNVFTCGAS